MSPDTRKMFRTLAIVSVVGTIAALLASCNLQRCSEGADCSITRTSGPSTIPTATPVPSPSPSPTPTDPCKPVVGVDVSGPTEVQIGSVIRFDITPISPAGPLEGALDYCNAARTATPESVSANLRCVGSCGGFGPQFLATGVGPFAVSFRVEGAVSPVFAGTVVQ